jgi:hypothetical protein
VPGSGTQQRYTDRLAVVAALETFGHVSRRDHSLDRDALQEIENRRRLPLPVAVATPRAFNAAASRAQRLGREVSTVTSGAAGVHFGCTHGARLLRRSNVFILGLY